MLVRTDHITTHSFHDFTAPHLHDKHSYHVKLPLNINHSVTNHVRHITSITQAQRMQSSCRHNFHNRHIVEHLSHIRIHFISRTMQMTTIQSYKTIVMYVIRGSESIFLTYMINHYLRGHIFKNAVEELDMAQVNTLLVSVCIFHKNFLWLFDVGEKMCSTVSAFLKLFYFPFFYTYFLINLNGFEYLFSP